MPKTKNKKLDEKIIWDLMNEELCTQGEILSRLRKRHNLKRDDWFKMADKKYPWQMGGSPSNLSEVFNGKRSLPFSHIIPLISVLKLKEYEKNHYISELVKANLPDNLRDFVDENASRTLTKKLKKSVSELSQQVIQERSQVLYNRLINQDSDNTTIFPVSTSEYHSSPEIIEAISNESIKGLDDYRETFLLNIIKLTSCSDSLIKTFFVSCMEKSYLSKLEELFVPGNIEPVVSDPEHGHPYYWMENIFIPPVEIYLHAKLLFEYQKKYTNSFTSELKYYRDKRKARQADEYKNANRKSNTEFYFTVIPDKPFNEYCFHNFLSDIYKKAFTIFPELYSFLVPRANEKVINFEFLSEMTFDLYLKYQNSKNSQNETFKSYINKRSDTVNTDEVTPKTLLIDINYYMYFHKGSWESNKDLSDIFHKKFSRKCLQNCFSRENDVPRLIELIEQKRIEFLSFFD